MDDEHCIGDALRMMFKFDLPHSIVLTFTDAESALGELEHEDPDLFTTDIHHPKIPCPVLLARLAAREVKYPIFVISAGLDIYDESTRSHWGPGLNISFLAKPFLVEDLRRQLSLHLGIDYPELGGFSE